MRIFLDANVLVSVVNREYPAFTACAKILSLADEPGISLYTSTLSLDITWYFSSKKSGRISARKKMELLLKHLQISPCGQDEVIQAMLFKQDADFEDALQFASAHSAQCQYIVTSNSSDFYFSDIPVCAPDAFFRHLYGTGPDQKGNFLP
jgi:predicted nucleic acid-binding protein